MPTDFRPTHARMWSGSAGENEKSILRSCSLVWTLQISPPLTRSPMWIPPSVSRVATAFSFAETAKRLIRLVVCQSTPRSRTLVRSQTLIVLSRLRVTSNVWDLTDIDCAIAAESDERLFVRRECDMVHLIVIAAQGLQLTLGLHIPQPHREIARGNQLSGGRECER